ncbi:winged helix-turn-helix domain-containing protein [Actinospica durhamensis]|uniref:Winged helix-turn-helix domain-containing protein n=1 Tax=Actinospica durhamensis TaxID=1508375 RepID=A0A941IRQ6_9ACTN|nr:AfsR/SARP family transcriptional regulator [Actinospica durhamensis]MBR7839070.1 winged helix-turn-helix domain-containing protein [Actinospica durhamensis]
MAELAFRLLGPFEVLSDGRPVPVKSARQRIVLAILLMSPNHVVPLDRLIDSVWDGEPPLTARGQIQICVSALRRTLADPDVIETSPAGYCVRVRPEQLDYASFDASLVRARAAAAAGRLSEASEEMNAALRLWRGVALAGVPGRSAETLANRLQERRIMAIEDRVEIGLALGEHRELLDELVVLTTEHPLRERLHGFLMLALYRSGRQAEALTVYRTARKALIAELGLEPSENLRHLERAILAHDAELNVAQDSARPSPERAPAAQRPHQLPADIPDFVGYDALVQSLVAALTVSSAEGGPAAAGGEGAAARSDVPLAVVTGQPGSGKSTLALHTAHLLRARFPDGQLFAAMHGDAAQPTPTIEVIARFLRALGVASDAIPADPEERVNLLRSRMAFRKLLIVLDDVADENQIRDLLPGVPGPAVLATSRSRLAALPGAHIAEIGLMPEADSVRLLERIVGPGRVESEPEHTRRLARLCGGLPIALRIAGVRLASHPHWSVSTLVNLLADEQHRLDELSHGDVAVRPLLALVHDSLGPRPQQLFGLLSSLELHDFTALTAASAMDTDQREAARLLDDLAEARLLDVSLGASGQLARYRFQTLVRVYASERMAARDDSAVQRLGAATRVFGCLLAMANEAHSRIYGGSYTQLRGRAPRWPGAAAYFALLDPDPLLWMDVERPSLRAAVLQAAALVRAPADAAALPGDGTGMDELCWELAINAVTVYEARALFDEWRDTHTAALEAARTAGNRRGEAAMLASLGSLGVAQRSKDDVAKLQSALALFEELDDLVGQALAQRNLAHIDRIQGHPRRAVERYEKALTGFRAMGDVAGQAHVLSGLARAQLDLGDTVQAEVLAKESLTLAGQLDNRRFQAQALYRLGEVLMQSSQMLAAKAVLQETLNLTQQLGDLIGEAYATSGLGLAALETGELNSAEIHYSRVAEICQKVNERNVHAQAVFGLGRVYDLRSEYDLAERYYVSAVNAFAAQGNEPWHTRAVEALHEVRKAASRLSTFADPTGYEHPGA